MGNPLTMAVLFARVDETNDCEHRKLVDSLTDEPSRTPYPSEGSHGREGQVASSQSYTWTPREQPTNASGVNGDAGSI